MSNELVVRLCAPTLAGIKSGSMFSCPMDSRRELLEHVRRYNRMLVPKGLCMLPLRYTGKNALIYVFRPARLQKDLAVREARSILESYGYEREDPLGCIIKLMRRDAGRRKFSPRGGAVPKLSSGRCAGIYR